MYRLYKTFSSQTKVSGERATRDTGDTAQLELNSNSLIGGMDSGSSGQKTDASYSEIKSKDLNTSENTEDDLHVDDAIKEEWEREQKELKRRVLLEDVTEWAKLHISPVNVSDHPGRRALEFVGGVDISFVKGDNVNACAALVVLKLPTLEIVYEDLSMVALTAPYIPGFLAFREADFLVEKIEKLRQFKPEMVPQVIMVDGNGLLHPREFGLACHLGVLVDIPCLGVAKKLFQVDGLEKNDEHKQKILKLEKGGDTFPLVGDSGRTLGLALRSCNSSTNPIYISQGHKMSLDAALWVTKICCKHRIPEPTRQADIRSREYLRQNFTG